MQHIKTDAVFPLISSVGDIFCVIFDVEASFVWTTQLDKKALLRETGRDVLPAA